MLNVDMSTKKIFQHRVRSVSEGLCAKEEDKITAEMKLLDLPRELLVRIADLADRRNLRIVSFVTPLTSINPIFFPYYMWSAEKDA